MGTPLGRVADPEYLWAEASKGLQPRHLTHVPFLQLFSKSHRWSYLPVSYPIPSSPGHCWARTDIEAKRWSLHQLYPERTQNPHSTGHKTLTVQGFPLDRAVQRASDLHTSNCLSQPAGNGGLGKPWSTYHQSQAETTHRPGWTWQECARVCAHREFGNIRQVCYPLSTDPPREWEPREKEAPTLPGQRRDAAPGCDHEPDLRDAGLPPNRT